MEMLKRFYTEEDGMGTVELVMIVAALLCIALLFKDKITDFAKQLMDQTFDTSVIKSPEDMKKELGGS